MIEKRLVLNWASLLIWQEGKRKHTAAFARIEYTDDRWEADKVETL